LKSALAAAHLSSRPTDVALAFNLRANGAAVTAYAARKWLVGDSIPTQERIVILATWLGVHPSWLRFGDVEDTEPPVGVIPEAIISSEHLALISNIMQLPLAAQHVVRDLVASLQKMYGTSGHGPMPGRKRESSA